MRHPLQTLVLNSLLLCAGCSNEPPAPPQITASPQSEETITLQIPQDDIPRILRAVAEHFQLQLDLPDTLRGRTSIHLRDVTWRQIFKVTLAPVGHDFYERDGVVVVRTNEEILALPPATVAFPLRHQAPAAALAYLTRLSGSYSSVSATADGITLTAHPRHLPTLATHLAAIDQPGVSLERFTRRTYLPAELPELAPETADKLAASAAASSHELKTEVFTLETIDGFLLKPYLEKELRGLPDSRVLVDLRTNTLIVTAPASEFPRLSALVARLDDARWFTPPPAAPASTPP